MDIEQLRTEVEAISKAVKKLRSSGISDRALLLLIQHSCPTVPRHGGGVAQRPSIKTIQAVIDGMDALDEFVFGDEQAQ